MFNEQKEQAALNEINKLSNWGRWGKNDERGSLNLMSIESMRRGFSAAKKGKVYPLGQHVRENQVPLVRGLPPNMHFMGLDGGDYAAGLKRAGGRGGSYDYIVIGSHGVATHVDGLAHTWVDEKLYNGFHQNTVRSYGATRLGIENVEGIVGKGVLLDFAAFKGVPHLPADYYIDATELESCAKAEGVTIEKGDIVLIRTGWRKTYPQLMEHWCDAQPGIGITAALWLAKKEVVSVGSDNLAIQPVIGFPLDEYEHKPVKDDPRQEFANIHTALLNKLGMYLVELLDLEALSQDKVHEFLFCLAPLMIKGGTGSPVNPLAVA